MRRRLLVVEDDETIRVGLQDAFDLEGYDVTTCGDGEEARRLLYSRHFELVVLDLMLPGRSGLELLRELRADRMSMPILVLTARSAETDKVLGLELGADDYVTKPFSLRELVARVRALLRRSLGDESGARGSQPVEHFSLGEVEVDLAAFEVRRGDQTIPLSPKEAAMLALLHSRRGRAVRREDFLDEVWRHEGELVGNRTVDTHVLNLRQKLESDPRNPRHLLTVHGVGYRLDL